MERRSGTRHFQLCVSILLFGKDFFVSKFQGATTEDTLAGNLKHILKKAFPLFRDLVGFIFWKDLKPFFFSNSC